MSGKSGVPKLRVWLITLFFLLGGAAHFLITERFVSIMPSYLPWPRELVLISGVFELLGSVGVLFVFTRRWAGFGLVLLCLAVFPANLNMALNAERFSDIPAWVLYLRLPLQTLIILHIVWATELLPKRSRFDG